MVCPSCGREVPSDARFCPSCGLSLLDSSHDERRVVTVMFADVVGFTTLASQIDPEQVKRVVDNTFERLVAVIERYGGNVDKVLGDAIVALFGAPVAHEDDPERAVRAALEMQRGLGSQDVQMRIGINTGEVLVGTLARTDYTAMGDVVNIAARLQELAPPGRVMVGDATRQQCSEAIQFEAHQVAVLRGREQPETIWLAIGVDQVLRRPRKRSHIPLVGRTAERGLLRGVVGRVLAGQSAVVSVVGEAGIGKTHLVDDLLESLRAGVPEVAVFEAACAPYGETSPWSPLAVAVSSWLGLDRGDPVDRIRAVAAERAVAEGLDPADPDVGRLVEAMLHLLGQASALDRLDPTGIRDAVTEAVVSVLRRRSTVAPVVLWIDDLQYSHAPLRELLRVVVRNLAGCPFLLVVGYRSGEEVDWPPTVDRSLILTLPLGPLDHDESAALVERVTGGAVDPEMVDQLYHRSGGNPLFLTELSRLAAAGTGDEFELPGSLRALIAAQLDQLPAHLRSIVDNAAVLGTEGPVYSLEQFAAAMGQTWDRAELDDLVVAGFLELDDGWWTFRSDVVRDVAYQTLTKRSRAQRHAGVATVMARSGNVPVHDLAVHAATAAELLNELGPVTGVLPTVGDLAVGALEQAAQQSFDLGGHRRVISQTSRALALTGDPATRRTLLLLRASAAVELRQLEPARADLDEILESAVAEGDRVAEGEVHRLAGMIHQLEGDLVTARRRLGEAVDVFREIGDEEYLANALRSRGFAEVLGGSLEVAARFLDEAEEIYRRLELPRGIAWIEQNRAWVAFLSGDLVEAERRLDIAITAFQDLRDQGGVTWARGLLAFVMYMERRFAEAEAMSDDVLIEARRWGDDWGAAMMLTLGANLRLWSGRFTDAIQYGERALQGFRRIGDRFGVMQALAPLGRARAALGRVAEVERGSEELLAVGDAFGDLAFPAIAAAGAAMHLGQGARSLKLADEAVERMAATGADVDEARMVQALAQCQNDRADEALATLLQVEVESSPFATAIRAVAEAMLGDLDAALADADAVESFDGPSYFDRSLAGIAGAAAAHRLSTSDATERLVRVLTEAETCGDVQMSAIARATARRLGINDGGGDPALAPGWTTVVDGITG